MKFHMWAKQKLLNTRAIRDEVMIRGLLGLWLIIGSMQVVLAGNLEKAKEVFQTYSTREAAFDPAVADLYSEAAIIKNKRTYPTGQVRELVFPAPQYKSLIRSVMPIAKAKNDYSTYSDVAFIEEGKNVRIRASRYSVLKKYASPI